MALILCESLFISKRLLLHFQLEINYLKFQFVLNSSVFCGGHILSPLNSGSFDRTFLSKKRWCRQPDRIMCFILRLGVPATPVLQREMMAILS